MRRVDARDRIVLISLMKNAAFDADEENLQKLGFPMDELRMVADDPALYTRLARAAREEQRHAGLRQATFEQARRPEVAQVEYRFPVVLEQSDAVGWYSLAGLLHGPFGSPELVLGDLNARVEQWRYGARRLGGSAWRPKPMEVVVSLPDGTVRDTDEVLDALRRSWTRVRARV